MASAPREAICAHEIRLVLGEGVGSAAAPGRYGAEREPAGMQRCHHHRMGVLRDEILDQLRVADHGDEVVTAEDDCLAVSEAAQEGVVGKGRDGVAALDAGRPHCGGRRKGRVAHVSTAQLLRGFFPVENGVRKVDCGEIPERRCENVRKVLRSAHDIQGSSLRARPPRGRDPDYGGHASGRRCRCTGLRPRWGVPARPPDGRRTATARAAAPDRAASSLAGFCGPPGHPSRAPDAVLPRGSRRPRRTARRAAERRAALDGQSRDARPWRSCARWTDPCRAQRS